jgi:sulfur carrier protein ThiS
MKTSVLVVASAILLLSNSSRTFAADVNGSAVTISQSTVTVSTDADGGQVQSTTIRIDRADLTQPHILRVQGLANDVPIRLQRVEVKVNGKVVRSIASNSLELNLASMMKPGRNEVEISGSSLRPDDTISVDFSGKNTNVSQQFSGTGMLKQTLVINIQ